MTPLLWSRDCGALLLQKGRQEQAEAAVNASHLGRATYDSAAVAIQAAFRGHVTRQDLRRQSVLAREQAAIKIQVQTWELSKMDRSE